VAGTDVAGNGIYQISMDGGARYAIGNVVGKPIWSWDARGHAFNVRYDAAQRPTHRFISTNGAAPVLLERLVYGEGQPDHNLCGRLWRHYDGASLASNERYDFTGNLTQSARQLASEYRQSLDWSPLANLTDAGQLDAAATALLIQEDRFVALTRYDALNRPIQTVTPHSAMMHPNIVRPSYNEASLLERLDVWLQQPAAPNTLLAVDTADLHVITGVDYNARGQRLLVSHGNDVTTSYEYDPDTFRLIHLVTTRPDRFAKEERVVQDLNYTYDPTGNITRIADAADTQPVIFFRQQRVDPSSDYDYDAVYRLAGAAGREHLGQTGGGLAAPAQVSNDDAPRTNDGLGHRLLNPGDGNAMGNYTERYTYDAVGNLLTMVHQVKSGGGWTRRYDYREPSAIGPGETCNQLSSTSLPGDLAAPFSMVYSHDAHGNMTAMPHLAGGMTWDEQDRLRSTARQKVNSGTPETTWYAYDAAGERHRKVTDAAAAERKSGVRTRERIYLGAMEIYREYDSDGTTVTLARESLQVMARSDRIALVETRTAATKLDPAPAKTVRFQYTNHLGSAILELTEQADVLSYEEYFPFGATAYQAVRTQTDVSKRYRYTGKERDEENDLYYHGARYYAPWLGRWTSCDPIRSANLYWYCRSRPTGYVDLSGEDPTDATVGPYKSVRGDHVHQVASRTARPGASRTSASEYWNALSRTTKDASYNDKAGQRIERAINRAAYGKSNPKLGVVSQGETPVGTSKAPTPGPWFEDQKSYVSMRGAGDAPDKVWNMVRESSSRLNEAGATPMRVPDAPRNVMRQLQEGQRLSPEGRLGTMKGQLPPSPIGRVVGVASTAAIVGQAMTELHEGRPDAAAKTIGVGVVVTQVLTKVPALVPLAIAASTISAYDKTVDEHAFAIGQRLAPNHPWVGGVVSATAATGESLFKGTFGAAGKAIGEGAAVAYIRLTSDKYTLVPWKSQIWANLFH